MKFDKLKNIISISKGKKHTISNAPTPTPKSIRFIQIDDLRNNDNLKFTDDTKGVFVNEDDLLIVWDGANAGTVGYGKKGFIGSTIAALKKKNPIQYDTGFLGKFLQTKFFYLRSRATGATIPHINRKVLETLKIPVFEKSDQIRIATLLSRAEALITKRKESIRLLDDLLKSTFWEMFGPEAKDFEEWPLIEIKELSAKKKGSMRTGPFGSNLLHSEFATEGDVAVLGIDNAVNNRFEWKEKRFISKEKYEQLKNYRVYPRDVIITIMGTTGRSAVIPDDIPLTINTKHLAAITLDKTKANPHFISYSIHSSPLIKWQLKSQTRGAIMSGLNLGIIKKLKINRPPIELQNQFAHIIKKVKSLKTKYEESLHELESLYGSLSQRAFRGELDLGKVPIVHKVHVHDAVHLHDAASPTVVIEKTTKFELNFKVVKELISKKLPKQFTFEALWEQVNEALLDTETHEDEEAIEVTDLQNYETVQKIVYKMLNGSKPFLRQIFNKESKERDRSYGH
ncbi:MAG: restriction endonuclease subunit S [Pseudomonadota bacterium]